MFRFMVFIGAIVAVLTLIPLSVAMLARARWKSLVWALILSACTASVAWFVRDLNAEMWKSNQSMHIRWNVTWLSDQYGRIDKMGDENLRRDYVTNFIYNACTLLNLDSKTAPNTSNLVERTISTGMTELTMQSKAISAPLSPSRSSRTSDFVLKKIK